MEFQVLREFVYVDVPKVRALLAQLDDGIIESRLESDVERKTTTGGVKGFAAHGVEWGTEASAQKSMGDALLPALEAALESQGLLDDASEELQDVSFWESGKIREDLPAGTLVRITSRGHLFDSRYVASALTNFVAATVGLQNVGVDLTADAAPVVPPKVKAKQGREDRKAAKHAVAQAWPSIPLEAAIPDSFAAHGVDAKFFKGIIQVSRGLFAPGLYLHLRPNDDETCVVSARLEEGRSYMDSEADVLFARYGVGDQDWTVLGTIGHHASDETPDLDNADFMTTASDISRSKFSAYVNRFMQLLGSTGFADLPQAPGFSVVPIAVYRTLNPRKAQEGVPSRDGV